MLDPRRSPHPLSRMRGAVVLLLVLLVAGLLVASLLGTGRSVPARAAEALQIGPSGLPLPRFVSLKANEVNVRGGPGTDHRIKWIFKKSGLPVEIVQEFENWRRIRDSEGDEGWVYHSLLSARRTALVSPWSKADRMELRDGPDAEASVVAYLQPGVLADVRSCDGAWCRVSGTGWQGYLPQAELWGVYSNEVFD